MRPSEIIIDSFAGGGGASLGIERALGRPVDVAINHDAAAIAMHKANHPKTQHYAEDVWKVAPWKVTAGRHVGLLWASPDCKHFSRAKGAKPVKKNIRSLAWVVVKWAAEVAPRVIILENVREFEEWGPLVPRWGCRECAWRGTEGQALLARRRHNRVCPNCDSKDLMQLKGEDGGPILVPDPSRKGLTFRRWVGRLRAQGYEVQWRTLDAADYGAPTHRKRLFLVGRRDGLPIVWPEPTHADPKKAGTDMFRTRAPYRTAAECIDWTIPCPSIFERKKPLAEATLTRIAHGTKRYVLNGDPFIVPMTRDNRPTGVIEPLQAVTTQGNRFQLVAPHVMPLTHQGKRKGSAGDEALPTITGAKRGELALIAPTLIQTGYGERKGQAPRVLDLKQPMGTNVAGGSKQALVAAFMAKHYGGMVGVPVTTPLPTQTERGTQNQVVAANLIRFNHDDAGLPIKKPMPAVLTNNHAALVYSFLVKYFGTAIGQTLKEPMGTATTKDRFGVVVVEIAGEPYVIVDIGMRMLEPRELARGQGFPDSYILTGGKTSQIARIGNSVPPIMAEVLSRANCVEASKAAVRA